VRHETKRQKFPHFPPGLYVVATPIGNLADMSQRAREALEHAEVVLCEDTRHSRPLLAALGLRKKTERLDAHAAPGRIREVVEMLKAGVTLALVTDAGTPGISDPAAALVKAASDEGVLIVPVPGPSAVTTLLSVSGMPSGAFAFMGFFPRKESDRRQVLKCAISSGQIKVYVWFESPERIAGALRCMAECAPSAMLVVAKELTKLHEKIFRGGAAAVCAEVEQEIATNGKRGEWCFAVNLTTEKSMTDAGKSSDWVKTLHCLLETGVSTSDSVKKVCQHFGAAKRDVYDAALLISGKKISGGD